LPAFLLCFTVCAHRIYAGKYISGIIQFALVAGSFIWSWQSLKGLIAILHSRSDDPMVLLQSISDWNEKNGQATLLPTLVMIAGGIWVAVDATFLLRRKFTDGRGNKITRWV
jgi:hypothetical protein